MSEERTKQAQEILSGGFLTRKFFRQQYVLIVMIVGLIFLYILFGFMAQRQQHRLSNLQSELKTKLFEQLTIEAELTERTRQSTMSNDLKEHGSKLKENIKPVIHIP